MTLKEVIYHIPSAIERICSISVEAVFQVSLLSGTLMSSCQVLPLGKAGMDKTQRMKMSKYPTLKFQKLPSWQATTNLQ